MRKISPTWKDLQKGYVSIARAQRLLELEWRRAVKVAERRIHQRKVQAWSVKVAAELRRQRLLITLTPVVFVILCSCALVSTLLPWSLLSWGVAIFLSLAMVGVLVLQTARIEKLEKNPPPRTADGRKYLNITEKWWDRLKHPTLETKVEGGRGEKTLLDGLEKQLPDQYLALHRSMAQQDPGAGVIVLAPNGIWLLETRYDSGKVVCRNGEWSGEKRYRGRGGIPKKERLPQEPYDGRWLRERESVKHIILVRLPQEMHWLAGEVRGGLVFTHPRLSLEIDPSCRVEYGRISDWVNRIHTSPAVPNMTTEVLLCIADVLLEGASESQTGHDDRSAEQLAVALHNQAEMDIPSFVKANL